MKKEMQINDKESNTLSFDADIVKQLDFNLNNIIIK